MSPFVYIHPKKLITLSVVILLALLVAPQSAIGSSPNAVTAQETTYSLSDLNMLIAEAGWGPVELDQSLGGEAPNDGTPITINGTVFPKGIGTQSTSVISFDLEGKCSTFSSWVGVDDDVGLYNGSVVFKVQADGQEIYDSGLMTGFNDAKFTGNLDISNVVELILIVEEGGDNFYNDHADWGSQQQEGQPSRLLLLAGESIGPDRHEDADKHLEEPDAESEESIKVKRAS